MQAEAAVEAALDDLERQAVAASATQSGGKASVAAVEDSLMREIGVLEKKQNTRMDDACVVARICHQDSCRHVSQSAS